MRHQNQVLIKNGISPMNWILLINMATNIIVISSDGDMLAVQFSESILQLISLSTKMTITTDALGFYVPFNTLELYKFMFQHIIPFTLVDLTSEIVSQITMNDDIRSVLTDQVNIDMFHLMSECMMDIDNEACDIEIEQDDGDRCMDTILVDTMVM